MDSVGHYNSVGSISTWDSYMAILLKGKKIYGGMGGREDREKEK